MKYSDEMLMAYVDRELDAATTASIDAALMQDPELATRVKRQRELAGAVHAAFEPVLQEPMPRRLLDAASGQVRRVDSLPEGVAGDLEFAPWGMLGLTLQSARIPGDAFAVALVPHTLAHTAFSETRPGDPINLEVDMLARYVERLLAAKDA